MTGQLERYDDNGEPVFAPEGDHLKDLWKFISIYTQNKLENSSKTSQEHREFDYTEFSKRLYLSRAELDVTSSVLQLLASEGENNTFNLSVVHHEASPEPFDLNKSGGDNPEKRILSLKTSFIASITKDLRSYVDSLTFDRTCEHRNICDILYLLREDFHCSLVRISNPDQIQVSLDYREFVPIIGINYCPSELFKNTSDSEQYNYRSSHQILGDNMALVLQTAQGDLKLLFQPKSEHIFRVVLLEMKDLMSDKTYKVSLFKSTSLLNYGTIDLNLENIRDCHEYILLARNRTLLFNLMRQISKEASGFSQDTVIFEEYNSSIIIESRYSFSISFVNESDITDNDSQNEFLGSLCRELLSNYLSSSASTSSWANIREMILSQ